MVDVLELMTLDGVSERQEVATDVQAVFGEALAEVYRRYPAGTRRYACNATHPLHG